MELSILKRGALFVFSRPSLFPAFLFAHKIILNLTNRVSAAQYSPAHTGEGSAFRWAVSHSSSPSNRWVIIDCGASVGNYTQMILDECKDCGLECEIHLIEPSATCHERLIQRFAGFQNIHVHRFAICSEIGARTIFSPWDCCPGASLSSEVQLYQQPGGVHLREEEVPSTTLDQFCAENQIEQIHFLKLDIEGFEIDALNGLKKHLERRLVEFIQIEIGSASLATKSMLWDFWKMLGDSFDFYLILYRGVKLIRYSPILECFYGASNFLLRKRR